MEKNLLRAPGLVMLLLMPATIIAQNVPPIAVNDTVYMCASTITIFVQDNDLNPDGDPLTLSIYAGSINGSFTVNGGAIDYTPNVGYSGLDSLVYVVCDNGSPPMCDTATVYIYVRASYSANESASICNGDSVFLAGEWQTTPGTYVDSLTTVYGCDSVITTTLNIITPPPATISASGPLMFCEGDSVTLTASAGTSWLWSNGATTQSITVDTTGTFSVTINYASGCSSQSASVSVTENPAPQATISASSSTTFCSGGSVTLTANSGSGWLWSNGDTTQSIVVSNSGTFSVTVNYGSCSSTSAPVTVTVNPNPVATISADGPTTFCQGDSVILTASPGTFWMWSNGDSTQSTIIVASGSYTVIVFNAFGCMTQSAAINVTVNPAPTATITANGPTTFCQGDNVSLTASSGSSWLWSTGDTTQSITVENSGLYSVTVSNGSCSAVSSPITIIVLPAPVAGISASGPTTFCEGSSVTLYATGGSSYQWSTGSVSQNITISNPGNYWVIVSNGSCEDTSSVISVFVNSLPLAAISADGPLSFCNGDSVLLTASNGSTWLWSNGATTQTIDWYTSGNCSCTVTDANGCSATSEPVLIKVLSGPDASVTASGPTTICSGESVMLTAGDASSWMWSTGETSQSIVVNTAGNYFVISSGVCGSDTSSSVAVLVDNGPPVAGFTASNDGYVFTFNDQSTGASGFSWNFGDNQVSSEQNPVHVYAGPGSYFVILIVSNACGADTVSYMIDISNAEDLSVYNGFSPNGDGHNDYWNIPMLDFFTDNTVTIVNRWGNEVWKGNDYDNQNIVWNGTNLNGDELPDGTYYYIISYEGKEKRGWVFIKR